jgi:hypothetical protein
MAVYDKISLPVVYGSPAQDGVDMLGDRAATTKLRSNLVFEKDSAFLEISALPSDVVVGGVRLYKRGEELIHVEFEVYPKRSNRPDQGVELDIDHRKAEITCSGGEPFLV